MVTIQKFLFFILKIEKSIQRTKDMRFTHIVCSNNCKYLAKIYRCIIDGSELLNSKSRNFHTIFS